MLINTVGRDLKGDNKENSIFTQPEKIDTLPPKQKNF